MTDWATSQRWETWATQIQWATAPLVWATAPQTYPSLPFFPWVRMPGMPKHCPLTVGLARGCQLQGTVLSAF
eukprot:3707742-Rhodomonas_salina.1